MIAFNTPGLKDQIRYLKMETEQNEETFIYIKKEFGEKGAELLGDRFLRTAMNLKAILESLKELENIKHFKQ